MIKFTPSQNKIAATAYTVASFAVVIAFIVATGWLILKLLVFASDAVVPVAAGSFLALFFKPYYLWLEKKFRYAVVALIVLFVTVFVPVGLVVWCAGSMIADEFLKFIKQLPDMFSHMLTGLESSFPKAKDILLQLGHSCERIIDIYRDRGFDAALPDSAALNVAADKVVETCAGYTNAVSNAASGVLPAGAEVVTSCTNSADAIAKAFTNVHTACDVEAIRASSGVLSADSAKISAFYTEYGELIKKEGARLARAGYEKFALGSGAASAGAGTVSAGHGNFGWALANCGDAVAKVGAGLVGFFQALISILVTLIFFVYFLMVKNVSGAHIANKIPLLKDRSKRLVGNQIDKLSDIMVSFYQRQVVICLIEGVLYGAGFWLVGLPYGFFIGFLLGILNLIPFFGSAVCLALAMLFAYFGEDGSGFRLVLVLVVWGLGQLLDGYYITPMIQGNKTGLGYAGVIFSFLFWSIVLGPLLGLLLAIPLSASCLVLWRTFCDVTKTQKLL